MNVGLPFASHSAGHVLLCEVRLTSARPQRGLAPPASWVETCLCPQGYTGQFCEFCALGYKREIPHGGPYTNCIPCTCNQHGTCDPNTGKSPESHSKAPWAMSTQWDEDWSSQMALGGHRHCFVLALFPGVSPFATKGLTGT